MSPFLNYYLINLFFINNNNDIKIKHIFQFHSKTLNLLVFPLFFTKNSSLSTEKDLQEHF